jgi:hypothetical protein
MTLLTFSEPGIKAMIEKDIDREKVRVKKEKQHPNVQHAMRRPRDAIYPAMTPKTCQNHCQKN